MLTPNYTEFIRDGLWQVLSVHYYQLELTTKPSLAYIRLNTVTYQTPPPREVLVLILLKISIPSLDQVENCLKSEPFVFF